MPISLDGKVAIITGASSGIGAATAVACAERGARLVLNARRADKLEAVAARVAETGAEVTTVAGDVADTETSRRLLDTAAERFGRFDIVFANAGYALQKSVIAETVEELQHVFEVNFFAGVDLLRAAAARLIEQKRPGHLLMCSSCLSKFALPYHGSYSATKAAQNAMCSAMRHELRPENIYVSSVHPITTTTEFFDTCATLSGKEPSGVPEHAPRILVQPPERVARAIVRCLERPCPEVWTSYLTRMTAGFMTMFPRFYDWAIRRQMKAEMAAQAAEKAALGAPSVRR
jgi:short-subunit dehydrogenase